MAGTTHLGHHTTSSDGTSLADSDAWKNNDISSKPAIIANVDRLSRLRSSEPIPNCWIKRMRSRIEATIGTNDRTSPNIDGTSVYPRRVPVYHRSRSHLDIDSIVGSERCTHPGFVQEELVIFFWARSWRRKRSCIATDSARAFSQSNATKRVREELSAHDLLPPQLYHVSA